MIFFTAGINSNNVLHCLWGSVTPSGHALNGVAVVSDIVSSPNPKEAALKLRARIRGFYNYPFRTFSEIPFFAPGEKFIRGQVGAFLDAVKEYGPLVHQASE